MSGIRSAQRKEMIMISRTWHGWTTPENADTYENLLKAEILPGIASKIVSGYRGVQLFRGPSGSEIEFMTVMWFDSSEDITQFAGEDYEKAYVPPKARNVLSRHEEIAQHYEIRENITY
jgi:heme-degrading monooxygenase HmoA